MGKLDNYASFEAQKFAKLFARIKERELTPNEIDKISRYLRSPVSAGIWIFRAKWDLKNGLCKSLIDKFDKYIKEYKEISTPMGDRTKSINIMAEDTIKIKLKISSFKFLLDLFMYIALKEKKKDDQIRSNFNEEDIILFEILDIESIKGEYISGYNLFINEIYYDRMIIDAQPNSMLRLSNGNIIYIESISPSIEKELKIISLDLESINIVAAFIESLNQVFDIKKERIFSPRDMIFGPYCIYLRSIFIELVENKSQQKSIEQAISEFDDKRYSHSINIIAIMAEEILVQIYESLFRKELDKNLTMGELFSRINSDALALIAPNTKKSDIDLPGLFSELKALDASTFSSEMEARAELVKIIRKLIHCLSEQDKELMDSINRILHPDKGKSIFPQELRNNFSELLKYRNAVSHNSTMQVNAYEASRSIYCAMNLLFWWNEIRAKIDWSVTKEEIIKRLFLANK